MLTSCISHRAERANLKAAILNKNISNLKVSANKCLMPHSQGCALQ